ncbi:hypothetical protein [Paracidovorax citrulli]|uniref:Uncharacterized protein n=2 Tax=Paracidovorax citrulli TaxID=80869 RepID=A1TMS6_PARC0|nr:hypothetical protein [Paracidovorax citrulli]ABM32264.1 hypothetical protein Aave_1677 [Paracidovorax citrulli AAC00-1]ATG94721.1 hypothetical protein CQB05_12360 [Paracidovorax citrulli]PVY66461.1 hypothetical protein C8E08_3869 [Paracidovorax citrulli]QCX12138.1 hypothetical protein APS58_3376 [Paracidovorax citrulli]REG69369.1 hypothetical protein C8E07_2517 [Paracidovorax citrulli]
MDTNNTAARGAAQSEALRLAAIVNSDGYITNIERRQIAAELRRLHALTTAAPAAQEAEPVLDESEAEDLARSAFETTMSYGVDFDAFRRLAMEVRRRCSAPRPQADAGAAAIAPDISADLERSDWTAEEALRWYAAGKHYDTVPNGDGTSSARILDNGAVASNALKSLSREYAEHKGDVALQEAAAAPQAPAAPTAAEHDQLQRTAVGWQQRAEFAERNWLQCYRVALCNGADPGDFKHKPGDAWHATPAPAAGAAPTDADTVDVVGVRASGEHVNLGKMPMPPTMKARDIATSQFGGFQDGDGSDAEMCFGALEELLAWLIAQGWNGSSHRAGVPVPTEAEPPDHGPGNFAERLRDVTHKLRGSNDGLTAVADKCVAIGVAADEALAQAEDAAEHNFNIIHAFDNWLLEQGHYQCPHTEDADGAMAPVLNWIASVNAMVAARARQEGGAA